MQSCVVPQSPVGSPPPPSEVAQCATHPPYELNIPSYVKPVMVVPAGACSQYAPASEPSPELALQTCRPSPLPSEPPGWSQLAEVSSAFPAFSDQPSPKTAVPYPS